MSTAPSSSEADNPLKDVPVNLADLTGLASKIMLGALAVFAAWAFFVPIDSAVVAPGALSSNGHNRPLQHISGGTIRKIYFREGASIAAGEKVLELDPSVDRARLTKLSARRNVLLALKQRLEAEKNADTPGNDPLVVELRGGIGDLAIQPVKVAAAFSTEQQREFVKGRKAIAAQLATLQNRVEGRRQSRIGMIEQRDDMREQLNLLRQQLTAARRLARNGHMSRQQAGDLELRVLQTTSSLADLEARIEATESEINEVRADMDRIRFEDERQTSQELTEVLAELEQTSDELTAAREALRDTSIRAPVAGKLVHFTATVGAVVKPGDTIGEIVPADAPLEARGRVPLTDITSVAVGQEADIRISALNARLYDPLPATVTYVAADATTDERTGESYYEVRAALAPEETAKLREMLLPGMGVEMFVKGRPRTFASYLLEPLTDGVSRAFREPS